MPLTRSHSAYPLLETLAGAAILLLFSFFIWWDHYDIIPLFQIWEGELSPTAPSPWFLQIPGIERILYTGNEWLVVFLALASLVWGGILARRKTQAAALLAAIAWLYNPASGCLFLYVHLSLDLAGFVSLLAAFLLWKQRNFVFRALRVVALLLGFGLLAWAVGRTGSWTIHLSFLASLLLACLISWCVAFAAEHAFGKGGLFRSFAAALGLALFLSAILYAHERLQTDSVKALETIKDFRSALAGLAESSEGIIFNAPVRPGRLPLTEGMLMGRPRLQADGRPRIRLNHGNSTESINFTANTDGRPLQWIWIDKRLWKLGFVPSHPTQFGFLTEGCGERIRLVKFEMTERRQRVVDLTRLDRSGSNGRMEATKDGWTKLANSQQNVQIFEGVEIDPAYLTSVEIEVETEPGRSECLYGLYVSGPLDGSFPNGRAVLKSARLGTRLRLSMHDPLMAYLWAHPVRTETFDASRFEEWPATEIERGRFVRRLPMASDGIIEALQMIMTFVPDPGSVGQFHNGGVYYATQSHSPFDAKTARPFQILEGPSQSYRLDLAGKNIGEIGLFLPEGIGRFTIESIEVQRPLLLPFVRLIPTAE